MASQLYIYISYLNGDPRWQSFCRFKVPTKQAEEHQDVNLQTWKRHDGPMVGKCHDSDDEKLDMTTINIYFADPTGSKSC